MSCHMKVCRRRGTDTDDLSHMYAIKRNNNEITKASKGNRTESSSTELSLGGQGFGGEEGPRVIWGREVGTLVQCVLLGRCTRETLPVRVL